MATINLRSFPYAEDVACPKCKQQITLYDPEGSEYCVCISCSSFIHFTNNDTALIQKQADPIDQQPVLKLGSVGMFKGYQFKVIGYVEKKEQGASYAWREYILYNYEKGYANFAEYDGHWTFVAGKEFYPALGELKNRGWTFINYEENEYTLFSKYTAVTTGLIGEFDWDILFERPKTTEFVAPPQILYIEHVPNQTAGQFYLGEYTEPAVIADAFKTDIKLFPERVGIGANQPSVHAKRWFAIYKLIPVIVLLLAVVGFGGSFISPEYQVLDNSRNIERDTTKANEFKPYITPSFELNKQSALNFKIQCAVDNNWLEATVVLVNEKNNQSWEVTESIEYYHGVEGGESWSEGSQEADVLLSAIPAGKYHLNVYPAAGDNNIKAADPTLNIIPEPGIPNINTSVGDINVKTIHINVTANPIIWKNFWVSLSLLCLYPLYTWWRMRNYEKRRWMNSDYSPYETEE
ncbi:DUF4178 domain-containing protein [Mucilaginibacter sp. ZT4R22]|uniref:DUF4178 domain-containing protein n=1 Tax=Mucilaginibacter pankratovii TaxID=2772110 RepID=A0ABR7WZ69_9SPHI|nr:DUF4178 domain-containing protein [Mucilaginibacter pankratovii]MBD1367473.1 DUF4178 domain-containing protein [Mucilaginibacter pankratovii]